MIPVYNVAPYVDRCVCSVVRQSYPHLEIILVDDGSTDGSGAICDAWARRDSRIKVIHKTNEGLGMARNTGMELACGGYLCFVDSDDFIAPGILEKALAQAEKEDADLTVFGLAKADPDGQILEEYVPRAQKHVFSGPEVQEVFLPDMINSSSDQAKIKDLSLSVCVCLFRMELIRRANWTMVSERQIISEDSYSLMELFQHIRRVTFLPEVGYYYCFNQRSLTNQYRHDRFEKIKEFYLEAIKLHKALGYADVVAERLGRLYLAFCVAAMKQMAGSREEPKIRRKHIKMLVLDETTQQILRQLDIGCYNKKIRLLFYAMRHKAHGIAYLLVRMQSLTNRGNPS